MACGEKTKFPDMTAEEMDRFTTAFRDEKFREMLFEYTRELSDPEKKRQYEAEIKQMELERGNCVEFVLPQPFKVLKTSLGGKQKCFINICTNENIAKPEFKWQKSEDGRRGQMWSIPNSVTPGRQDKDAKGNKFMTYDVIFHSDTLHMASKNTKFMDMVDNIAVKSIQDNYKVKLDKNTRELTIKYKGSPVTCMIRKPSPGCTTREPLAQPDPLAFPYPGEKLTSATEAPKTKDSSDVKPEAIQVEVPKSQEPITPTYTMKYRSHIDLQDFRCSRDSAQSPRPKEIIVTVDLPLLKCVGDTSLEVRDRSLELRSRKPAYRLEVAMAYPVDDDKGQAKFDKQKRQLIITLPVLPSPHTGLFTEEDKSEDVCHTGLSTEEDKSEEVSHTGLSTEEDKSEDVSHTGLSTEEDKSEEVCHTGLSTEEDKSEDVSHTGLSTEEDKSEDVSHTGLSTEEDKSEDVHHTGLSTEEDKSEDVHHTGLSTEEDKSEDVRHTGLSTEEDKSEDVSHTGLSTEEDKSEDVCHTGLSTEEDKSEDVRHTGLSTEEDKSDYVHHTGLSTEEDKSDYVHHTGLSTEEDKSDYVHHTGLSTEEDKSDYVHHTGLSMEEDKTEDVDHTGLCMEEECSEAVDNGNRTPPDAENQPVSRSENNEELAEQSKGTEEEGGASPDHNDELRAQVETRKSAENEDKMETDLSLLNQKPSETSQPAAGLPSDLDHNNNLNKDCFVSQGNENIQKVSPPNKAKRSRKRNAHKKRVHFSDEVTVDPAMADEIDEDDLPTEQTFPDGDGKLPPASLRETNVEGGETVISDHSTSAGFTFKNSLLYELD